MGRWLFSVVAPTVVPILAGACGSMIVARDTAALEIVLKGLFDVVGLFNLAVMSVLCK
jgi:hypothetical protein